MFKPGAEADPDDITAYSPERLAACKYPRDVRIAAGLPKGPTENPRERAAGRMSHVPTVRGPVDTADLGPAYMHEHIFVLTADVQQN